MGYQGDIPARTWDLLAHTHISPLALESNRARAERTSVALLASLGYISIIAPDGLTYTGLWLVTAEGLQALKHYHMEQRRAS